MRVRILKNTVAAGVNVKKGQVVEIPKKDASILFLFGKAELATGGEPAKAEPKSSDNTKPDKAAKKQK